MHAFLRHRKPRINEYAERKRTEQSLIARSGKAEAEVTIENCARLIVLLKLTTDKHEASRGLSAAAVLLVSPHQRVTDRRTDRQTGHAAYS